ncbi:MAG: THUMP domain-containing protein [Candidatus Helarchaeota archaeon]
MRKNFNLLISCPRFHERDAKAEIKFLFNNIGDESVRTYSTTFPGLITAKTEFNPIDSIRKLRTFISDDSTYLKYVLKIVPIEKLIDTSLENIVENTKSFGATIQSDETFRITLKNRRSPYSSQEIIVKVAEQISRKVNLSNPDKIIMIQILGDVTGISLLQPQDILSKVQFQGDSET